MSHEACFEAKFLAALGEFDARHAERVRAGGCPKCGGPLDCGNYPRKPRGELGEAAGTFTTRTSFCCRVDGCRARATPASLRFLGRKVYVGVLVVIASVVGREVGVSGRGRPSDLQGVPVRTVRRWLGWWQTVFALGAFWTEAKALFATPVEVAELPASLLARFAGGEAEAVEKLLRFVAPVTTTSVRTRITRVA